MLIAPGGLDRTDTLASFMNLWSGRNMMIRREDFTGGRTTTGTIGENSWNQLTPGGSIIASDVEYGYPGIVKLTSGTPTLGATAKVTSIVPSTAPIGVVTTENPHGLSTGQVVTIADIATTPASIGTHAITVTGPSTFTIPVLVTSGGAGGTYNTGGAPLNLKGIAAGTVQVGLVTTSANHGYTMNQLVNIAGSATTPPTTGDRLATVLSPTTFTIPVALTAGDSVSAMTSRSYLNTSVTLEDQNRWWIRSNGSPPQYFILEWVFRLPDVTNMELFVGAGTTIAPHGAHTMGVYLDPLTGHFHSTTKQVGNPTRNSFGPAVANVWYRATVSETAYNTIEISLKRLDTGVTLNTFKHTGELPTAGLAMGAYARSTDLSAKGASLWVDSCHHAMFGLKR